MTTGLYQPVKIPSLGSSQEIINRQLLDSVKNINSRIKVLDEDLNNIQGNKEESLRHIKGNVGYGRTIANENKEINISTLNNTVDSRVDGDKVYLNVKNAINALPLTQNELDQLCNIDSVTISNAQWGYLGALDQDLITTSNVQFNDISLLDNKKINFGTTNKGSITNDGTDMVFDSREVGTGDFLFNNGNIGINHTNPSKPLDIFSNTASEVRLVAIGNSLTGFFGYFSFDYSGNTLFRMNSANTDFVLGQKGIDMLYLRDNHIALTHYRDVATIDEAFLKVGIGRYGLNSYQMIGFGSEAGGTTPNPVAIGYYITSNAGYSKGDFVVATRDTTGSPDVPTVKFRVKANGDITFGSGIAGYDQVLTIDGETNDWAMTWMEDEDYAKFEDDILLNSDEKVYLRDTAIGIYSQADTCLDLFADGAVRIGDSSAGAPTNYVNINSTGDLTFNGSAGFYPVRIAQSAQPTPDTGELVVWRDTDDGKVYLVYNDTDSGVKQVEMT